MEEYEILEKLKGMLKDNQKGLEDVLRFLRGEFVRAIAVIKKEALNEESRNLIIKFVSTVKAKERFVSDLLDFCRVVEDIATDNWIYVVWFDKEFSWNTAKTLGAIAMKEIPYIKSKIYGLKIIPRYALICIVPRRTSLRDLIVDAMEKTLLKTGVRVHVDVKELP